MKALLILCLLFFSARSFSQSQVLHVEMRKNQQQLKGTSSYGMQYLHYKQADNVELLKRTDFFKIAQSLSTKSYNFSKDKKACLVQSDAIGTFSENPRVIGLKGVPGYKLRVVEVECELLKVKRLNFETDMHFKDSIEMIH